jgi:hypothetical protein
MKRSNADREEKPLREVVDEVSSIWKEADGRIAVGLRKHAQMYFLHAEDGNFRKKSDLLRESLTRHWSVRLKFVPHEGWIMGVESCSAGEHE